MLLFLQIQLLDASNAFLCERKRLQVVTPRCARHCAFLLVPLSLSLPLLPFLPASTWYKCMKTGVAAALIGGFESEGLPAGKRTRAACVTKGTRELCTVRWDGKPRCYLKNSAIQRTKIHWQQSLPLHHYSSSWLSCILTPMALCPVKHIQGSPSGVLISLTRR